jgi:dynein intermediate chain
MSTMFARFHPNLIVGGTYCGQIVLWDNRSNKQTPVQRTPLSAKAHTVNDLSNDAPMDILYSL